MKFSFSKFLFLFVYITLVTVSFANAKDPATEVSWQERMTRLSSSLTNVFPFLYSRSEFKDPQNGDSIRKHLQDIANTSHVLPAKSGESIIGAEPLIASAQMDMHADLEKSLAFYKDKKFPQAQSLAQNAIQKCFACHTAHQVGPHFPEMNPEIFAIATPFMMEKAVVFGALRQFDGALKYIESKAYSGINKANSADDNLVKIYLVIALRSTQEFSRAKLLVERLKSEKLSTAENSKILDQWLIDIKAWQDQSPFGEGDSSVKLSFIQLLRDTYLVHNNLMHKKTKSSSKADSFLRLAKDYSALNLKVLNDLPLIYLRACRDASLPSKVQSCTLSKATP